MKPCPFCAEEIQEAAIRCRWCRSDLTRRGAGWPLTAALGLGAIAVLLSAAAPTRSAVDASDPALFMTAGAKRCPALSALPPDHPPVGNALPPGHPPVAGALPPGHPPVGDALPPSHPPVPAMPQVPVAEPRPLVRTYAL